MIELFNSGGIDALITRPRPGRPRKAKLERVRDLLLPVLENPASAGQVHWTGVKLHGHLKEQLSIELGYSTAVRWLHELNFHLRLPRPWPERQNEEDRKTFQEELRVLAGGPKVQLWYGDESGVEGDPRPRRRWVQPGQPRTVPFLGDHIRQNVIGAVAPPAATRRLSLAGLRLPHAPIPLPKFMTVSRHDGLGRNQANQFGLGIDGTTHGDRIVATPSAFKSSCLFQKLAKVISRSRRSLALSKGCRRLAAAFSGRI